MIGLLVLGAAVLIRGLGDKSGILTLVGACDAGLALLFLLAGPLVRRWSGSLLVRVSKAEAASSPGRSHEA